LLDQLRDVAAGGHRALVFSQFTGFLGKVRGRLDAAGLPYCYLDGKTRNRATMLQHFKDGTAPVFLISLKAGGFGLNLTVADYCFLLDPWWNPATEAQAVDQAHQRGSQASEPSPHRPGNPTAAQPHATARRRPRPTAPPVNSVLTSPNQDQHGSVPHGQRLSQTAPSTHETRPTGPGLTCSFACGR
jgi:Helicase conserved C-terminal domain